MISRRSAFHESQPCRSISSLPLIVLLLFTSSLLSCGGGGSSGGSGGPPPPVADFSLVVEIPRITVQQQGAYVLEGIAARTSNGFSGTVHLTLSGLPAGVTTLPAGIPDLFPTGVVQDSSFQLVASSAEGVGSTTITVTATSGSIYPFSDLLPGGNRGRTFLDPSVATSDFIDALVYAGGSSLRERRSRRVTHSFR